MNIEMILAVGVGKSINSKIPILPKYEKIALGGGNSEYGSIVNNNTIVICCVKNINKNVIKISESNKSLTDFFVA